MRRLATFALAAALTWVTGSVGAEDGPSLIVSPEARRAELDAVTRDIGITAERQAELKAEIDKLDKDQASLNAALIEGGRQVQALETQIGDAEKRLSALMDQEAGLRASLAARRGTLAEVLAALQRLGYRPPPAILVEPDDALASIHSAMLLGALVPDLRRAADALADDLKRLVALRQAKEQERDKLRKDAEALAEGRTRIQLLIDQRQAQRAASAEALATEEKRAAALADQATSLRDLIARVEKENAAARAAAAAAAESARVAHAEAARQPPPDSLGSDKRLTPKVAFANARGLLPLPTSGPLLTAFGGPDGLGGHSPGVSFATRPGATISTPADGWVVFAGPFRSYGQLLIINAGDGYHVLLAGMDRIDVQLGQLVLAGEPVAVMPSRQVAEIGTSDTAEAEPVLYVEFRKDGVSIDPTPWWAASDREKVGG